MLQAVQGDQGIRGEVAAGARFLQKVEEAPQRVLGQMDEPDVWETYLVLNDAADLRG